MARAQQIQANRGLGQEQVPGRQSLGVDASIGTIAVPRDNTQGIQRAIQGFVQLREQKAAEEVAELNELATSMGYTDAAAGRVDEERMAGDEAYAIGVNKLRSSAKGFDWLSAAQADLDEKLKEDPNLNYDEWRQGWVQQYLSETEAGSREEQLARARFVAQFEQNTRHAYGSGIAKIQAQEQMTAFANATASALRNTKPTPDEFRALVREYQMDAGLEDGEARHAVATILLERLGRENDVHADELARSMGLYDDAAWGSKFAEQRKQADARIEADRERALKDDIGKFAKNHSMLRAMADKQQITPAFLEKLVADGEITPETAKQALGWQWDSAERALVKAQKDREAAEAASRLDTILNAGDPRAVGVFVAAGGKLADLEKRLDQRWAQAELSGDENEFASVMLEGSRIGLFPKGAKRVMDGLTVQNREQFKLWADRYRRLDGQVLSKGEDGTERLETEGLDGFYRRNVSSKTYAQLEMYTDLIEKGGMSPDAALDFMASSQIPIEDAQNTVRNNANVTKAFSKTMEELGAEGNLVLNDAFRNMTAIRVANGIPIEAAAAKAAEEIADRFSFVHGTPIDKRWLHARGLPMTDIAEEVFDTYTEDVLKPKMVGRLGADMVGEVRLLPHPDKPRTFVVLDPITGLIYTENNTRVEISAEDLYSTWAKKSRPEASSLLQSSSLNSKL